MPDLRFLSEAAFFIGCGVGGLPLMVLGYLLGMQHPRYKITYGQNWYQEARWKDSNRVRFVERRSTFYPSGREAGWGTGSDTDPRIVAQERSGRTQTQKKPSKPGTAVRLNRRQKINLCALILNSPASDSGLPREDVPLTYPALKRHGIGRKAADRIREDIVRLRLGWKDDAGTVYLNRHKAREFVARARRAGVIGG